MGGRSASPARGSSSKARATTVGGTDDTLKKLAEETIDNLQKEVKKLNEERDKNANKSTYSSMKVLNVKVDRDLPRWKHSKHSKSPDDYIEEFQNWCGLGVKDGGAPDPSQMIELLISACPEDQDESALVGTRLQ